MMRDWQPRGLVRLPPRALERLGRVKDLLAYRMRYPDPERELRALERQPVVIVRIPFWSEES